MVVNDSVELNSNAMCYLRLFSALIKRIWTWQLLFRDCLRRIMLRMGFQVIGRAEQVLIAAPRLLL